jgi:hypothetical protein
MVNENRVYRMTAHLVGDEGVVPVGEYPDVPCRTSAQAFDALDSLCQELEAVKKANAELLQENVALAAERDKALYERDTARASDLRRGW